MKQVNGEKKMKWVKLKKLLVLTLCFQLFYMPISYAQAPSQSGVNPGMMISGVMNMAQQALSQLGQQDNTAQITASLRSNYGIAPLQPHEVPSPFAHYGCIVFPARLPELRGGQRCDENPADPSKMSHYVALKTVSEENAVEYRNFLTPGNSVQANGLSCYQNALTDIEAKLNARIEALHLFQERLQQHADDVMAQARPIINQIKTDQAMLTGSPAELLLGTRVSDQFQDEQCQSFVSTDQFNQYGQGGLNGIVDELTPIIANGQGNGALSPANFLGTMANRRRDIDTFVDGMRSDLVTMNPSQMGSVDSIRNGITVRSQFGVTGSEAFTQAISTTVAQQAREMRQMQDQVRSNIQGDAEANAIFEGIAQGNSYNFDQAISEYENGVKNNCLNEYLVENFGDVGGLAARLQDPNQSSRANSQADSLFKNAVNDVLRSDMSIEDKLRRIQELESSAGGNRYGITTGSSRVIDGQTIGASERRTASAMLQLFTRNCIQQYQANNAPAVEALTTYRARYQAQAQTSATAIANALKEQLTNCPQDSSTGSAAGSCQTALNPNQGSFCLRTAQTCANNMRACMNKAQELQNQVKTQQLSRVNNYRQVLANVKRQMFDSFNIMKTAFVRDSRYLDTVFKTGTVFNTPLDLDMNITGDDMLLDGVPAELQMEDPQKYFAKVRENIASLERNLEQHKDQLLNGTGSSSVQGINGPGLIPRINQITQNYQQQEQEWQALADRCLAAYESARASAMAQHQQATEQANERNQVVGSACSRLDSFNQNPNGFCGQASELANDIMEAAQKVGSPQMASQAHSQLVGFDNTCHAANSDNNTNYFDTSADMANNTALGTQELCQQDDFLHANSSNAYDCSLVHPTGSRQNNLPQCTNDLILQNGGAYQLRTSQVQEEIEDGGRYSVRSTTRYEIVNNCTQELPNIRCTTPIGLAHLRRANIILPGDLESVLQCRLNQTDDVAESARERLMAEANTYNTQRRINDMRPVVVPFCNSVLLGMDRYGTPALGIVNDLRRPASAGAFGNQ